jgi:hypothetical protein
VAVGHVVAVLHRDHLHDLARLRELLQRDVRDAHVQDLALVLKLLERADGVLVGHLRIGRMQLVQVDPVELQPPQAGLAAFLQALRPGVARPLAGAGPPQAALGGDHEAGGVGMQRLGDQVLAHLGAVRVGRVDQVDAELDHPMEQALGLVGIVRRAPDAVSRDPHRAEPEPAHLEVSADREGVHAADASERPRRGPAVDFTVIYQ